MKDPITLTEAAVRHIQQMLAKQQEGIGFRLSIKKTGCSGYSYVPDLVSQLPENDIVFVTSHGLKVFVDREALPVVKDLVIDYVAEDIGLKQKRLVFINPKEKNRCGCGESFTIE